jgi:integrase
LGLLLEVALELAVVPNAERRILLFRQSLGHLRRDAARIRQHIARADIDAVLRACPDAQWRLLIVLARYAGLRIPSEALMLRWCDINWEDNRMVVRSPKTEHLEGRSSRTVPIFPEIKPHLLECFEHARAGEEFVITRYRRGNQNLRTQLGKIVRRAGITGWVKPWQNMRATRETELAAEWPVHVVCAWMGNTPRIAMKHDLNVTEGDFDRAGKPTEKTVQNLLQWPVQNRLQHAAAEGCTISQNLLASPLTHRTDKTLREDV